MNFIITLDCNKGCPYCFASKARKEETENRKLSIEEFKKLIKKVPNESPIKLLGGEPTQHPQFIDFVDATLENNKELVIISNFLFNENILSQIKERCEKGQIHFLINSTDLDKDTERLKTFIRNYNEIYKSLYKEDKEINISCGLTFDNDKDWQYYVKYIQFLYDNLIKIEKLRLSISFPDNKKDFSIINNKSIGKKFLYSIKKCIDLDIPTQLDCIILPCLFENKEEWKFINNFMGKVHIKCDGAPTDIFPDGTVSHCYPLKDSIKVLESKYDTLDKISLDMKLRYNIILKKVDKPDECKKCHFMEIGMCDGPCLGFYNLNEETIGINI